MKIDFSHFLRKAVKFHMKNQMLLLLFNKSFSCDKEHPFTIWTILKCYSLVVLIQIVVQQISET
jgi:hypothetical protein